MASASKDDDLVASGTPLTNAEVDTTLEQYTLFVQTADSTQNRRQSLHAFFMTINTLLMAGGGLVIKIADENIAASAVLLIALMGGFLTRVWLRQIRSHEHVMTAKWTVVDAMESALSVQPFRDEYAEMQKPLRGRSFVSFTKIEARVPDAFFFVYVCGGIGAAGFLLTRI